MEKKERKTRFGATLKSLRLQTGLTQEELARDAQVNREYIGSMEVGRIDVVYPEVFNRVVHALKNRGATLAGWELLDAMGYETGGSKGEIYPPLQRALEEMDEPQQRAVFDIVRSIGRASGALA